MGKPAHILFGASVFVGFVGVILALSGLASQQQFCASNNPFTVTNPLTGQTSQTLGLIAGVKPTLQYAVAQTYAGRSCATVFRYEWWGWALQITFITITAVIWVMGLVPKYKAALWSLAATAIVLSMQQANALLERRDRTTGTLKTRGEVAFIGYVLFCVGAYLAMFAGCALYREKKEEREATKGDV